MHVEPRDRLLPVTADGLLHDEVHVWWYDLDVDTEREAALERTLADEERLRASRFRFAKHRRRFVVGRGTLREIVARYAGTGPQALRFEHGAHGKPRLDWPSSARDLGFNASDSHGIGAVAVARGPELGLDLERVCPDRDCELIASREFAQEEIEWLRGLPESERARAFFELWTCKEAYLKGKGLGLTASLNCFAVRLSPAMPPRLVWSSIDDSDPQRWSLHRLAIAPGFVASLAVQGGSRDVRQARWFP
jgi:4'-phosphopantetheinyl transferase